MRLLALPAVALASLVGACGAGGKPAPSPPPRPRSVLLVTIDTLRADRLGCYGDGQARTPHIDRLAAQGVLFESAFTPAPITLPAHATLLTGLDPPAHGVRGNGRFRLRGDVPTLAEALRARGMRTAAFVGAFPLSRRFGLHRGFDHYDDAVVRAGGVHYEFPERRATEVVGAATAWLSANAGPAFVWVHVFDPHAPYDPPPGFPRDDPYRGEIAAVDAALLPLFAAWDARQEPSLVVLAADHGEAFGEHGEESHSLFVYDVTLRVPLLLRGPGLPAGTRVRGAAGLVDVAATVLDAVGAPATLPGTSLLGRLGGAPPRPLYAETFAPRLDFGWSELASWRDGRWKLIRAPRVELYDVERDPAEIHDVASRHPEVVARAGAALQAAVEGPASATSPLDPAAAERLRALGYAQGPAFRGGSGADPKDKADVARRIARAAGPFADHAAAVAAYEELLALDPRNPLVRFRLADALLRAGRARDSIVHFEAVIDAEPGTAEPFVGLATAHAELGRLADAERALRAGLEVEPANGQAHFNLGEIARVRGRSEDAARSYEAALADPVTRDRAQARLSALR